MALRSDLSPTRANERASMKVGSPMPSRSRPTGMRGEVAVGTRVQVAQQASDAGDLSFL